MIVMISAARKAARAPKAVLISSTAPAAYETLLTDVMAGDATLFMRADQVEASWSILTVARLMRRWAYKRKADGGFKTTTKRKDRHRRAPNVLAGDFSAMQPNEKWVSDITYIPTHEGWMYLAAIQDVFSRRIVGWSMSERLTKGLVCEAWNLAVGQRGVPRLHHSDQGSQYTTDDYLRLLEKDHVILSMSDVGCCYDNAMQESFWGTLKTKCVDRPVPSRAAARKGIFEYIACRYNRQRRHSALGYLSPAAFEQLACP